MKPFQEQHREEQPRLVAAQPGAHPVAALDLAGGERDRPAPDVRVAADLVGMGMVAVVLGDPPAVAEPNQQVAVNPADQAVHALGAGDLAMPGVVPMKPVWVNITAKKTATSSCHHDRPSTANTAQPAASSNRFKPILKL